MARIVFFGNTPTNLAPRWRTLPPIEGVEFVGYDTNPCNVRIGSGGWECNRPRGHDGDHMVGQSVRYPAASYAPGSIYMRWKRCRNG